MKIPRQVKTRRQHSQHFRRSRLKGLPSLTRPTNFSQLQHIDTRRKKLVSSQIEQSHNEAVHYGVLLEKLTNEYVV